VSTLLVMGYAALAGVGNLIGGLFVTMSPRRKKAVLHLFVGFGAGFMLALAFFEMVPTAIGSTGGVLAIVIGYLAVHFTQHVMTPHFHFGEETHPEAMVSRGIGVWALIGLIPHSFFDGVAISAGFTEARQLGMLIFLSVLLHKVPTGVSLASIMVASGHSARRAVLAVLLIGLATVVGAGLTPIIAPLAEYGLGLAAGVTIYVAASNLVPETQHARGGVVQVGLLLGVVVFYLTSLSLHTG
jgi:zinc and cadmium transporter